MKALQRTLILAMAAAAAMACHPAAKDLKTETFEYTDSTAHAHLSIKAELPVPGAADAVRARLIDVMDRQLSHIGTYEDERQFPAFEGNAADSKALMAYYQAKSLETLGRMGQEDYDERVESISENDGITEEEKADLLADMPGWEYDFSLTKDRETDRYVVFLSEDYVYLGGAHGGILGRGPMTFDKKDGHLVEQFLETSSLQEIQPLLRKGLVEYFSEDGEAVRPEQLDDWLMLEGGLVPFPAWTPYPSEEGLVFTYQQYEIASYAAGMPSFTLSYDDLRPYFTQEAKDLLGIRE
ncbi:MAG: DUF3298 domain-containing protein [Bacteroidales bacterium]|nr:DUF3298 domain-containing protein [Bacteroidales bacterium]